MQNVIRRSLIAFALVLCYLPGQTQEADWILSKTQDGIQFYYKVATCGDHDLVFLKLENTNDYSCSLMFDGEITTDGAENLPIPHSHIFMEAKTSKGGDCKEPSADIIPMPVPSKSKIGLTLNNVKIQTNKL